MKTHVHLNRYIYRNSFFFFHITRVSSVELCFIYFQLLATCSTLLSEGAQFLIFMALRSCCFGASHQAPTVLAVDFSGSTKDEIICCKKPLLLVHSCAVYWHETLVRMLSCRTLFPPAFKQIGGGWGVWGGIPAAPPPSI